MKSGPTTEEKAAVVITAAAKGHAARKVTRTLREEATSRQRAEEAARKAEEAARVVEEARQVEAAKKITSLAKGNAARKRVRALKESKAATEARQAMLRGAEVKAAQDAADAAIQEAIIRERHEAEAKAALAKKTAEFADEIENLSAGVRERDRQLHRLKGELASQASVLGSRDALIEELRLRIKELEAELSHAAEMVKLAAEDVKEGKAREDKLAHTIKKMAKPATKVCVYEWVCAWCVCACVRACVRVCAVCA